MPKLTWMNKSPPKVNYLEAVMKGYKRARGMTSEDIAKKLGCSPENVRTQLRKPAGDWKVGTVMRYCDILQIPYEEAFREAAK